MARENFKIKEIQDRKIKLATPTIGMGTEGDLAYSKAYTQAIQNGILPRIAMEKYVNEQKLWTNEDDLEVQRVSVDLQEIMALFSSEKDTEKKNELKLRFYNLKNTLTNLSIKRQSLFLHTAESKGEEAKISSIAWKCILNEDGSRVWGTQEVFLAETDTAFASLALQEFLAFSSGIEERQGELEEIFEEKEEEIVEEKEVILEDKKEEKIEIKAEEIKEETKAS